MTSIVNELSISVGDDLVVVENVDHKDYLYSKGRGKAVIIPTSSKYVNADELMKIIKTHSYQLQGPVPLRSTDYGMFVEGIQQAVNEAPGITFKLNEESKEYV